MKRNLAGRCRPENQRSTNKCGRRSVATLVVCASLDDGHRQSEVVKTPPKGKMERLVLPCTLYARLAPFACASVRNQLSDMLDKRT